MFPDGSQFDLNDKGEIKHISKEGVEDVTPKKMFANFTVTHKDTGNILMKGSQINTPGARAHIEKESHPHKVTWHDED
jgi:hypothetical protein